MRLIITFDDGRPHGLGHGSLIVEPATRRLQQALLEAAANDPESVLSIPNARLHMDVGTSGTASLRAGWITDVREG